MPLDLTIVTPQGEAFHGPVEAVVLPGSEGDFGVLPRHERLLTSLRVGEVEIKTSTGTRRASISEGFADVSGSEVVVMVTSCKFEGETKR
ncbi:MAG TPA: ATP synthase F1 subunit epsilon [Myxococcota bacterium]|jgi:F-type H+-transporting ATPase subunit epsilon